MRNLTTLRVESASVDQDIKKFFSCDAESRIYVISEDNILHVWNLTTNKEEDSIPLEGDDLLENNSVITGCQYIPDLEATCICTKGGDILLYEDSETEIVGSFSAGIVCMSWSPDYELVIFVTQNKTLVQMTKNWDIVTEVTIPGFEDEQSNSNLNSDFTASLSWRGDGKVFACLVSSQSEITEQTQPGNTSVNTVRLHVFDRACVHESSSEQGVKIEPGNLSWRPSGSVITCTQRLPHRYDTIFFERNGLRHGEFTFRDECTVQQLEWNSASDLLAILVVKKDPNTNEDVSAIQIWYMNNWHWYLKQEFLFGAVNSGDDVIAFHWDEEDPLKLICICKAGEVRQFIFHWDTNVSEGLDKQNQSTVAVIDGDQLLLTPLRRLVPPPPMAATTLSTSASIRQVFYAPKTYDFFVVHSNATIEAFKSMQLPQFNPAIKKHGIKGFIGQGEPPIFDQKPESLGQFTTNGDLDISKCYQWICVDSYTFMALYCDLDDLTQLSKYKLILVNYSCSDKSLTKDAEIEIPGVPLRLYNNPDTGSIFLSLTNNEILRFSFPDELTNFTTLPTACATIQSVCFGPKKPKTLESLDDLEAFEDEEEQATGDAPEGEVIIALNNRSRLYVNNEEVSRECNSFAVHDRYILFSTLTHKLRFIDHSFPYSKELLETTPQHMYDVCNREVERGSRIVAVVPYDTKVVLQMPRGNLETIYPRALLLSYCRSLLNNLDYRTAFLQMRNHRIDLNLLHDHNPSQFLENVEMFINALDSPTFLNLFLSSLIDDDVTVTLFPKREQNISSLVLPPYLVRESKKEGKVNRICTAVRSALETMDTNRYLLSILTTLVKQNPPHFGEALEIIRKLRNNERTAAAANDSAPTPADKKQITAESALDYMVFLVDVNHLYDVALSLYDFELTIMVASKSQKDPKEYLPFLKDLHALSPKEYQYYTIDMHLKNYRKALKNISKLDGDEFFEKAIQLIKQENLYALGIHLYYENEKRRFEIQKLYGEYLFQNSNYEESAIVFQQCKEWEKAFNSYLRTSEWQMVFALAEQLNYTPEQMVELANKVSTTYRNMGRFEEAGRILVEYANDPAEAIQCLTQGTEWKSALRLCHKYHMEHEISNLIDPAVQESHVIFMEMVESKLESYQKQFERLKVVKRSKILMPQIVNLPTDANLGDMFSETSSFASSRSSFSYVSVSEGGTKNRRRKKKKRISGKEGSLYEEEYLVEALKKLIPTANEQREVNELLKVLLLLGHNEEAEQLQNLYSKLNTLVESSLEVLIAPLIPMPGHEEELEEDERIREKIETKERLDRLYKSTPWNLSCIAKVD